MFFKTLVIPQLKGPQRIGRFLPMKAPRVTFLKLVNNLRHNLQKHPKEYKKGCNELFNHFRLFLTTIFLASILHILII